MVATSNESKTIGLIKRYEVRIFKFWNEAGEEKEKRQ